MGVLAEEEATELASFLGVLAHTSVSILYSDWRKVPPETKKRLWKSVLGRFIVHPISRKQVIQSIGTAFRNFKYMLTKNYIWRFPNDKKKLYTPSIDYPQIKRHVWIKFVDERLSESVEKISRVNKNRRSLNKCNYRLSRKGYVGLMKEICAESGLSKDLIDRSEIWKRARMLKNLGYDLETEQIIKKLEKLKEDQKDSFTSDAKNDLLAQALGKLPRTGHMQGLGKFISGSNYFHTIRGPIQSERERDLDAWKKLVDAQLQEICRELKRTPRHSDVGSSTFPHNKDIDNDSEEDVHQKKRKWMSSQKEEQPRKNEETPKNATAVVPMKSSAIPMKSAINDDYNDDNELHA
ncbi:hypothetical protein KPL71_001803 [Citrus sinensis]|uniref:Uncharacterized protein n=1 Tax=Citrus sinensis TaxID=2711 RepID=A0ACB8P053_CITSI|nr:hypothetical protein KPL71_001803 [Citrus sinensis]